MSIRFALSIAAILSAFILPHAQSPFGGGKIPRRPGDTRPDDGGMSAFRGRISSTFRGENAGGPSSQLKPDQMEFKDGVATIQDRKTFRKLAYQGSEVLIDTHLNEMEFIKFQIEKPGTEEAMLYFINTKTHRAHMMFMRSVGIPMRGFGRGGGRDAESRAMRGVMIYRPLAKAPNGEPGVYTFEFEPNDDFEFRLINFAHEMLVGKMPILEGRLGYCPLWGALDRYVEERSLYDAADFPTYFEEDFQSAIAFLPLNAAESYGRLRLMDDNELPTSRDVVIYRTLPNEMPRTAGVITGARQTPLSHVNLRAIQDKVPNAYIADVTEKQSISSLIGKLVYYRVAPDGYELREATNQEVENHFSNIRPSTAPLLKRNLAVKTIRSLDQIEFKDSDSVGVKAANLAALGKIGLPRTVVPSGYAIPFHFYDAFMKHNNFYQRVVAVTETQEIEGNRAALEDELKKLRKKIKNGTMPEGAMTALAELQYKFPKGLGIRARSSTNNEDLPGFSGAGLYDSYTHQPDEGHLSKTIKQVYASMWNFRAFEEREFYRVNHLETAMGVLIHPNYDDEKANGVAVTDDILYQTDGNYYVNTQLGEDLVTNPNQESVPEELLLDWWAGANDKVMRQSNRVTSEQALLPQPLKDELRKYLGEIHLKFATLYEREVFDATFAMEIEFKVTRQGSLAIKQARPWVY